FEEGRSLKEVLLETQEVTEHMSESEIDRLLDPTNYLGIAPRFVDKVLEAGRRAGETNA
ncbi:MAG: 3-carboxy-cis,cis-muconate cycloisomerase, partial [Chloroflexi bacterium]|nr:3-carboxy-cis,cis-muconate cycloisomerase [Chloroflexota bacterium]